MPFESEMILTCTKMANVCWNFGTNRQLPITDNDRDIMKTLAAEWDASRDTIAKVTAERDALARDKAALVAALRKFVAAYENHGMTWQQGLSEAHKNALALLDAPPVAVAMIADGAEELAVRFTGGN